METQGGIIGEGVHLADVDTVVTSPGQQLHPRMAPLVGVFEDAGGVRVVTGKQAGPGGGARGGGDVTIGEGDPFVHQPVQVGGVHIRKAQSPDGVKALLVGDDEDDVGL